MLTTRKAKTEGLDAVLGIVRRSHPTRRPCDRMRRKHPCGHASDACINSGNGSGDHVCLLGRQACRANCASAQRYRPVGPNPSRTRTQRRSREETAGNGFRANPQIRERYRLVGPNPGRTRTQRRSREETAGNGFRANPQIRDRYRLVGPNPGRTRTQRRSREETAGNGCSSGRSPTTSCSDSNPSTRANT
jgi:hypothetical protein